MMIIASADGTTIKAVVEGAGPPIVVLHAGMNDETAWRRVAAHLTARFRVVRIRRRRYRMDLDPPPGLTAETADAVAVARALGRPVLLIGHSSGGVVALEALLAAPDAFAGAILYEPAVLVGAPLGGDANVRARAALASGRPRRAIQIFLRDVVRLPRVLAWLSAVLVAAMPRWRRLIPRQLDDTAAIDAVGDRRTAYTAIQRPVLLLGGERSPQHLAERLSALAEVIPGSEQVILRGQGHGANLRAPARVADVVAAFADRLFARTKPEKGPA